MPYKNKEDLYKKQKEIRIRNRTFLMDYLKKHPCISCGESDLRVLEFDHIDPTTKKESVSKMVSSKHYSIKRIEEEISKCQVLCANCHRKKTHTDLALWWGRI